MNQTIDRIKKLRDQIAYLDRTMLQGEYSAAGLSIGLTIGAINRQEYDHTLEFECSWYAGEILKLLRASLAQSLEFNLNLARKDLEELNRFLNQP